MNTAIGERRRTVQKEAVRQALEEESDLISAAQLHQRLDAEGTPVGLATVYRQLNALAESGHANTIPVHSGQLLRVCDTGAHHGHLVRENCGTDVETDLPHEEWIFRTAMQHGLNGRLYLLKSRTSNH